MTRWALVADLNRCVGCQTCTAACKHANATAPGIQWRKVLDIEAGEYPNVRRAFVPVGCMHCDEPPCMEVCPTTATGKRDDGIVTIDYDLCIGCAYCAVACPYQARSRVDKPLSAFGNGQMKNEAVREDPQRIGVAQKCTFCLDRIDAGIAAGLKPGIDHEASPACVASCIAGALHFGDVDDKHSNVSKLLNENRHFRMHYELGTGPGIYYLWDKAGEKPEAESSPVMVAEPAGMGAVGPAHQQSWDWRAAANFIFGGAGSGMFIAAALAGITNAMPGLVSLAMVALGLLCVWLEVGRPWRFINVYFNPANSWMSREATAALPFFGFGLAGIFFGSVPMMLVAAVFAAGFLYCQAQILRTAKGIPLWRHKKLTPLMVLTGLSEGTALFALWIAVAGTSYQFMQLVAVTLLVLTALRHFAWRGYRQELGREGAPARSLKALDASVFNLSLLHQLIPMAIAAIGIISGTYLPTLLSLAALPVLASGWIFKYCLITKAAFNQGYAIERMPARGAGESAPGIKPGWTVS
ncbi:MAG: 4Fe-4S dicluster domain-containing protein [Hyphomicrobiales bacterium]